MSRSAERSRWTGVDEDVILLGMERSPLVKVCGGAGTTSSGAAAGGAVADELNGGDGAVLLRAYAESLIGTGAIADGEMFLLAIEHESNRGSGLAGERGVDDSRIACAELCAESASHVFGDDAHLGFGKVEKAGKLLANAGCSLGGCIDGELLGLPVSHHPVRFERGVGLYLGGIPRIHNHIGIFESLFCIP